MKNKFGILIFVLSILLSACSTDFEVIGDWKETMVVYGLLDQSKPKQFIKINKAFLGEGNAFEYAQIKDSIQYKNALTVTLKRIKNGAEIASYNLTPDNSIPKNSGIFYSADQTNAIYSFVSTGTNALNVDSQYKLIIKNSDTGKEVSAQTTLVKDYTGLSSNLVNTSPFSFITPGLNTYTAKFPLNFKSGVDARIYQVVLRLHYTDTMLTGPPHADSLDWTLPQQTTSLLSGGQFMDFGFNGQDMMRFIGGALSVPVDLKCRTAGKVDVIVIAAGDDLNTFINVNKPSTGIIQEKPEYTNIANGLGIFSSRVYKIAASKPLNPNSINGTLDTLSGGQYTCKLKFLDASGIWNGCQ